MRVLDLFAGTGSSTAAFEAHGHTVVRVELDPQHEATLHADVRALTADGVRDLCGGTPDFVWASPPCTTFSVASIGHHWAQGGVAPVPKTEAAVEGQQLVQATLDLIQALGVRHWLMENPRGMLRKLPVVRALNRWTVTYCQYGDERQKPTDLWGVMPRTWLPFPPCQPGASCHVAAPRGARTGTQGRKGSVDRSRVPYRLSDEIRIALEAA